MSVDSGWNFSLALNYLLMAALSLEALNFLSLGCCCREAVSIAASSLRLAFTGRSNLCPSIC